MFSFIVPFMVENGISVVAVDEATGKIVGTFVGQDIHVNQMGFCESCSWICSYMSFVDKNPRVMILEELVK